MSFIVLGPANMLKNYPVLPLNSLSCCDSKALFFHILQGNWNYLNSDHWSQWKKYVLPILVFSCLKKLSVWEERPAVEKLRCWLLPLKWHCFVAKCCDRRSMHHDDAVMDQWKDPGYSSLFPGNMLILRGSTTKPSNHRRRWRFPMIFPSRSILFPFKPPYFAKGFPHRHLWFGVPIFMEFVWYNSVMKCGWETLRNPLSIEACIQLGKWWIVSCHVWLPVPVFIPKTHDNHVPMDNSKRIHHDSPTGREAAEVVWHIPDRIFL